MHTGSFSIKLVYLRTKDKWISGLFWYNSSWKTTHVVHIYKVKKIINWPIWNHLLQLKNLTQYYISYQTTKFLLSFHMSQVSIFTLFPCRIGSHSCMCQVGRYYLSSLKLVRYVHTQSISNCAVMCTYVLCALRHWVSMSNAMQ